MDTGTAIALIQQRLGSRSGLESLIGRELEAAREAVENRGFLPWFLLQLNIVPFATDYIGFPSGFLRFNDRGETGLWYRRDSTQVWSPLTRVDLDVANTDSQLVGSGAPLAFVQRGLTAYLRPVPIDAFEVQFDYYRTAGPIFLEGNLWMQYAPNLICAIAGQRIAQSLRDTNAAGLFQADISLYESMLREADTASDEASRTRYMGE